METDLNKKVNGFMKKYNLESISEKSIISFFKSIPNEKNEYGNIFHALIHFKYQEEKVLKMIEILGAMKVDINFRGKMTGYNFIQLALYGYTKDGKDYSYSTDFILKLIRIAKKYNLDVNTIDNDGDTIIHTALASEVYDGKTVPLLKELGSDFDIEKKDNNGNNIYKALLRYKKEAQTGGSISEKWLNRLLSEEQEIKIISEIGNFTLSDIDNQLENVKAKLDGITDCSIANLYDNYAEIIKYLEKLNFLLEKRKFFDEENTIYHNLENKYRQKIKLRINEYLKALTDNPNLKDIEKLEKFLETHSFTEELSILVELKNKYVNFIESLKLEIKTSDCLNALFKTKEELLSLKDEGLKQELLKLTDTYHEKFSRIIENIKNERNKRTSIEKYCFDNNIISSTEEEKEEIDFNTLKEEELLEIYQEELNKISSLKEKILKKAEDFANIFANCLRLINDNDFSMEVENKLKVMSLNTSKKNVKNNKGKRIGEKKC